MSSIYDFKLTANDGTEFYLPKNKVEKQGKTRGKKGTHVKKGTH